MSNAVLNLWHIKRANGMYYFGADYVHAIPATWQVFVRKGFPLEVLSDDLRTRARILALWAYPFAIIANRVRGGFLLCPSPHPLPFLSRQLVVLHDSYPFIAGLGRVKKALLKGSLRTSHCRVGYINRADSLNFLQSLPVPLERLLYMPNFVKDCAKDAPRCPPTAGRLRIGLIGSDSVKKAYATLFDAVRAAGLCAEADFCVYGHATDYLASLRQAYPEVSITLVESDHVNIAGFFERIDVVVSVSRLEGFCRPVASALTAQIPCFLLEDPVFLEFYSGHAHFSTSAAGLLSQVMSWRVRALASSATQRSPSSFPPGELTAAFQNAASILTRIIGRRP